MHISEYKEGNIFNHDEKRTRKLLLHKKEILKLFNKVELDGNTLVPIKLYFKGNKAKILLGLARGKKHMINGKLLSKEILIEKYKNN